MFVLTNCKTLLENHYVKKLFVQQLAYVTSGSYTPKLPLNFIDGRKIESEDKVGEFSVEEPATGLY